jgi:EmrB/QacA subfamily drug resistance transporter
VNGTGPVTARGRLPLILAATAVALFCVNLDLFALNLALPRMARSFAVSTGDLQWVISAYLLVFGAMLVFGGRLGDIFGRRKVLLVGLGIFGASSLACGLAPDAPVLIAFRVVQGVGAALLWPTAVAVVANAFPKDLIGRSVGLLYGLGAIGIALGPFAGGTLTGLVGWRWVFWINVPFALVAMALTLKAVPESRDESVPRHLDLPGVVLLTTGIAVITLALDRATAWGWVSAPMLGSLLGGTALLVSFVLVERRVRWPLVDLRLFRNVPYDVVTIAGMFSNMAYTSFVFLSTLYLQQVRGLSPIQAGLIFLAPATAAALAGPISGRLVAFNHPTLVMAGAVSVGGTGLLVLSVSTNWLVYIPAFGLTGLGVGVGWAFASAATQQVVDPSRAGEAAGMTLTVLITMGGLAVAAVATSARSLQMAGTSQASAIHELLRIMGVAMVVLTLALLALHLGLARMTARSVAPTLVGAEDG